MADQVQLDKDVIKFLNSYGLLSQVLKVLESHGLTKDDYQKIAPLMEKMVQAPLNLKLLPKELANVVGQEEKKVSRLAADLAGFWLLPLEAHMGDVAGYIIKWGGDISVYPKDRVAKKSIDPMQFTRETLETLGIKMDDASMQNRLEYVLSTLVRGVRVADDAKAVLARSKKVGGLDMEEAMAGKIVEHFVAKMENVEIDRGPAVPLDGVKTKKPVPVKKPVAKTVQKPAAKPAPKKVSQPAPKPVVKPKPASVFSADTFSEEDEREAREAAKKIKKAPSSPVSISKAVDKVVKTAGIKFKTEEGEKRFRGIIETRLRGVRDAMETRDILEDTIEQGGLGLSGVRLADVVEMIEKAYDEFSAKLKERKDKEKQEYLKKRQEAETDKAKLARAEADVLAKRYANLTGKAPSHLVTPAAPTAARVSASRKAESDIKAAAAQIDEAKVKKVMKTEQPKPAPATAHMSSGSVTREAGKRPQVRDVIKAKKLVGPVDELGQMDTISFRRLSSDSEEATLKIMDKIELLEGESYAKRLEGIRAWQQSPLNKLYLSIMRESLVKGLPVKDIVHEIGAKEQALTNEEVQSIMKLNKRLKF